MKLKYNHNGATDTIILVDNPPPMHRLAIHKNGKNFYAKLGEPNHPEASRLKSVRNGKPYAAIKNYDPILFDECGNQVELYAYDAEPIKPTINHEIYKFGNSSIEFKGTDSALKIPNISLSSTYTIDLWRYISVRGRANPARPAPITFGVAENVAFAPMITLAYWDTNYAVLERASPNLTWGSNQILPIKTWMHVAFVVHDGVGLFFNDGVLVDSKSPVSNLPSNSSIYLGMASLYHYINYGKAYNPYFKGCIAEFRFSDGIARWTENFTPPTEPYEVDEYTKVLMHF